MTLEKLNPHRYETSKTQMENLLRLCSALTIMENAMGRNFTVTSGLRSAEDQERINPVHKKSAHLTGEAADLADVDGSIYQWCIDNVSTLIEHCIYLESRTYTPRWIHVQIRAPKSGNRFFIP